MRRALYLTALILVPGAAVGRGLLAAWRYITEQDDLTDQTMNRIRADCWKAEQAREWAEAPVIQRSVMDVPRKSSALSRPWSAEQ